jgi:hypothetical protein
LTRSTPSTSNLTENNAGKSIPSCIDSTEKCEHISHMQELTGHQLHV